MKKGVKWALAIGVVGVALILLGAILGWVGFPLIVQSQVKQQMALKEDSDAYDRWKELPLPMQFKIWIFDVQNPHNITDGTEEPRLVQRGPYVWNEHRQKNIMDYNKDEDWATYTQSLTFEFQKDLSDGSETDYVIVPNVPLIAFVQITSAIDGLSGSIATFDTFYKDLWPEEYGQVAETVFVNVTVKDYIFGGIKMNCNWSIPSLENIGRKIMCESYENVHPPTVNVNLETGIHTFAFFAYKNGLDKNDGVYKVRLGLKDYKTLGQVISWNGQERVDKWSAESCNVIKGTDSTIFRPIIKDVDELFVFNTDICRTIKLTYKEDSKLNDIKGRRYVADRSVFASVVNNTDNHCYCPQSVNNGLTVRGGCLNDGVLELSSCQGAPVVLSHPLFLYGETFQKGMTITYPNGTAVQPNEADHQIFLDLEPNTGTPLRGASRVQMNIQLRQVSGVKIMKNFENTLFPILVMDEGVELTDDLQKDLHHQLLDILNILNIVRWVLIGLGIGGFVASIGVYIWKK